MSKVTIHKPHNLEHQVELPIYETKVPAGFPSPAEEYLGDTIDLDDHLIKNKTATFLAKVVGDSMIDAGIYEGDLLVIDRSVEAKQNSIVIAAVDGEFTVKRLCLKQGVRLMPENPEYEPLVLTGDVELLIWGVATSMIRKF